MIYSVLQPKLEYKETQRIAEADEGVRSFQYELIINDKPYLVVIGKPNTTKIEKHKIIYFPIYLVSATTEQIRSQIGLFEINSMDIQKYILYPSRRSEENVPTEYDVAKFGSPLLYSFVDDAFLKASDACRIVEPIVSAKEVVVDIEQHNEDEDAYVAVKDKSILPPQQAQIIDATKDATEIHRDITSKAIQNSNKVLADGIFTITTSAGPTATGTEMAMTEETKEIADEYKQEFRRDYKKGDKGATSTKPKNWVQSFMENKHYSIIENEGAGDCFFAVVRDAYRSVNKETTVDKLRAVVAKEITETHYQTGKQRYMDFKHSIEKDQTQITANKKTTNGLKKIIADLAKQIEIEKEPQQKQTLNKKREAEKVKYNELKTKIQKLEDDILTTTKDMEDVAYFSNIHSLEEFREYIKTSRYWADEVAIEILERVLRVKFIILSQTAYEEGDIHGVMKCTLMPAGEGGDNDDDDTDNTNNAPAPTPTTTYPSPEGYIIMSYTGRHYTLIEYKKHSYMTFRELPYGIKILIINKCLEKNSGVYALIKEFRDFKSKLGISGGGDGGGGGIGAISDYPEHTNTIGGGGGNIKHNTAPQNTPVFTFYIKSQNVASGKGIKEKTGGVSFGSLNKKKEWRRKLDDDWTNTTTPNGLFTLDDRNWASVTHYMEGAKFKKTNPEFTQQFSLDSDSEISKDVALAKLAGSKTGKKDDTIIRPLYINMDADYEKQKEANRREALMAKFGQPNKDLNEILLMTAPALLQRFIPSYEPRLDTVLMDIRNILATKRDLAEESDIE